MKSNSVVSYAIRNLTDYRVLFVGEYTLPNPRTAYWRADGGVTIRCADPKDTTTFDNVNTVWGVKHDTVLPGQISLVD